MISKRGFRIVSLYCTVGCQKSEPSSNLKKLKSIIQYNRKSHFDETHRTSQIQSVHGSHNGFEKCISRAEKWNHCDVSGWIEAK